jgi:hypothetical protein
LEEVINMGSSFDLFLVSWYIFFEKVNS